MRNQELKLDPIAMVSVPKRIIGSELTIGAHRSQKGRTKGLDFFSNISKSIMIQRLRFEPTAMFDLLNILDGLDHNLQSQNLKKKKKRTAHEDVPVTVAPRLFPFRQ